MSDSERLIFPMMMTVATILFGLGAAANVYLMFDGQSGTDLVLGAVGAFVSGYNGTLTVTLLLEPRNG
jgi:hypothetical protein